PQEPIKPAHQIAPEIYISLHSYNQQNIIKVIMWLEAIQQFQVPCSFIFSQYRGIDNNEQIHTAFLDQGYITHPSGPQLIYFHQVIYITGQISDQVYITGQIRAQLHIDGRAEWGEEQDDSLIEGLDVNIRDVVRREYLLLGPCQPKGHIFPKKRIGDRQTSFQESCNQEGKTLVMRLGHLIVCHMCYQISSIARGNFLEMIQVDFLELNMLQIQAHLHLNKL
ncbi:hypothetical protein ACJX0J_020732, partial [Zea mays]